MELAQKLFSTRGGTLLMAGLAAVLAAVAVLVYLSNYRSSVKAGGVAATVLVAKQAIPKGTPGTAVASQHMFQAIQIRESQLQNGAISDPGLLSGRVAANEILQGEQLTVSDFVFAPGSLASRLEGAHRAITIPIDAAHGLIGQVQSGNRVDVYAGFNVVPIDSAGRPTGGTGRAVLRLVVPNVSVLGVNAPKAGTSGSTTITLDVTAQQAANLAFAADNGKLWLVLRPTTGAKPTPPNLVTVETLLLGIPPVAALKSFGARG